MAMLSFKTITDKKFHLFSGSDFLSAFHYNLIYFTNITTKDHLSVQYGIKRKKYSIKFNVKLGTVKVNLFVIISDCIQRHISSILSLNKLFLKIFLDLNEQDSRHGRPHMRKILNIANWSLELEQ